MTDDGGTEDVQVNVSTCSPEVVPQSLVDPGDESRGRLRNGHSKDSGGAESRSKDLPAPEVPQVRQPPREFQRMPSSATILPRTMTLPLQSKSKASPKKKAGKPEVETYPMSSATSSQELKGAHGYTAEEMEEIMMCYTPPPESDASWDGYPDHPDCPPREFPLHLFRPA